MEKIKSRWRKKYLEGDTDPGGGALASSDLDNSIDLLDGPHDHNHHHHHHHHHGINSNNIHQLNNGHSPSTNNHQNYNHHHHHHRNKSSSHHHKHHHHHHNNHSTTSSSSSSNSKLPQYEPISENLYLDRRKDESKSHKKNRSMLCDCVLTKEERNRGMMGCTNDCLNRMLMIECGPKCNLNDRCLNKRFQKCLTAKVEVFKTRKKGWGLRTIEDLPVNAFIMEYVGEVVRLKEFRKRVKKYTKQKIKHHYFMALKNDEIIDATVRGNLTRFINHSCEPNSETQKWTVNGELRIGFFTLRPLHAGEEITFDYQFQRYGRKAQKCYCEAPSCRGYIGGNDQSLNGNSSPQDDDENHHHNKNARKLGLLDGSDDDDDDLDDDDEDDDGNPEDKNNDNEKDFKYKIPKYDSNKRLEIEDKLDDRGIDDSSTGNNNRFDSLEPKNPFFTRNLFKSSSATSTAIPTNGFATNSSAPIPRINSVATKRRFDTLRGNNIELTPAPKMSKEEHRQQFEMNVRLKDYYDTLEKHYGPAVVEQVKLCQAFPYIYWPLGSISANQPPTLPNPAVQPPIAGMIQQPAISGILPQPQISNALQQRQIHGVLQPSPVLSQQLNTVAALQPPQPPQPQQPPPPQTPPLPNLFGGEPQTPGDLTHLQPVKPEHRQQFFETQSTPTIQVGKPKPTDLPTTIVLANNSIEPSLAIDDELAFSVCNYVKYYSMRDKPLTADDVVGRFYPFPGSYYTTPNGEKWFATITLDRKTRQPRTVIINLKTRSKDHRKSNHKDSSIRDDHQAEKARSSRRHVE